MLMFSIFDSIFVYIHLYNKYSIISILVSAIVFTIGIWIGTITIGAAFTPLYITILYIKYRFQQINDKLLHWDKVKYNDIIKLIKIHSVIRLLTVKINIVVSAITGTVYFGSALTIDFWLYNLTHLFKDYYLFRIYSIIIGSIAIFVFFFTLLIGVNVSNYAHDSYLNVNSIMVKKKMALKYKLKVLSFIETLSGPTIGIYCFDFFPFNNYEFYNSVAFVCTTYILILGFI